MRLPIRSAPVQTSTLSARGIELAHAGSSMDKFKTIMSDPYHPIDNPDGFVNIGTAENVGFHMKYQLKSIAYCFVFVTDFSSKYLMIEEVAEFANKHVKIFVSSRSWKPAKSIEDQIWFQGFHLRRGPLGHDSVAQCYGKVYQSTFSSAKKRGCRSSDLCQWSHLIMRDVGVDPLQRWRWYSVLSTNLSSIQGWLWDDGEVGHS